jgi:TctA family transporter
VYGSFLAFLPGIAGAYGGSVMRKVFDNLQGGR